jgi:riboflavin synthase
MFTGIIESTGLIKAISAEGSNKTFWVESPLSASFKTDQSVSHNGVCLTVEEVGSHSHRVTAIAETLEKTNIGEWQLDTIVNLEQCLPVNGRLDGHFVQGHVDGTGRCINRVEKEGSWEFEFEFDRAFSPLIIEKGSICVNGISLTAFNVKKKRFTVAIIPYTFEHTNIHQVSVGSTVNLEFDVLGKYLLRSISLKTN